MSEALPTLNALLNATSAALLAAGFIMIRRGRRAAHQRLMLSAVFCSALFLVGYLTRLALTGTHSFPGEGMLRGVYLAILISHMILAALVVPLVGVALYFAFRARFAAHKRVVRFLWPMWMYTSVTGVIVYVMLYHWA